MKRRKKNTVPSILIGDANRAQSLEGYLWAVTAFEKGKMQIRCLTDTHIIDIKPPLTIIYVGDGCEAYSNNLFIPAKSVQIAHWSDITTSKNSMRSIKT